MKLGFPFIQLPLRFDAAALASELSALDESEWRPHPQGFPGNSALPLVAVNGEPDNDGLVGPMRPTSYLERLPYLGKVLRSFGAVLGRTRLMRLSGQAEVSPHIDQAYYWAERMRIHVPIVTQPRVMFYCGDATIHMAAGECWIFDTWRLHRVHNDGDNMRIHLVADTIGGEDFWDLMKRSRPSQAGKTGWPVRDVPPGSANAAPLQFETVNVPRVMTPWELDMHLRFLFGELKPHPSMKEVSGATLEFVRNWQATWSRYGDAVEGFPDFRRILDRYIGQMQRIATQLVLRNDLPFLKTARIMVLNAALADGGNSPESGERRPSMPGPRSEENANLEFDRPVFIVSPPRSGSTLLFETLARAPNVYTIGSESHRIFEGLPSLHPQTDGYRSNRLDASAATPQIVEALRARFGERLIDRDGKPPGAKLVRMLEKTPKNSLRIPFLRAVFPRARFIYLYRDVRQTLASMIEAWNSGQFRMYPNLPGWTTPPWSLLLTEGWRDLIGKSLPEIVAGQWQSATKRLLDDLETVPETNRCVARYDALLADPAAEIARLCRAMDFGWDRPPDETFPVARHALSAPDPDKWRKHQAEIESVLPSIATIVERASAFAAR
ncbi:MAG TPA: sulfotransferase [Rudaea sp.]|nr:sulfotransferase [Rudaea sp.]